MQYDEFIRSKLPAISSAGFDVDITHLNANLFDFQRQIVKTALNAGSYAIFADCGLGKTLMQLEWANQVAKHTNRMVLILAPLAVVMQTRDEADKFGIDISQILITNYEQLDKIDPTKFSGVVLDESSILKNFTGKTKRKLVEAFADTRYKLCCTATPAPNDLNEIGNHSEFLRIMDANDMRMRWFVRNEGMNNYRLKGHAETDFYAWIASWASVLRTPADIGYLADGYDLPTLNFFDHEVKTGERNNGQLFNGTAVSATTFNTELRLTKHERLDEVAKIVNESTESWIVWVKQNEESKLACELIPGAVEVKGSDSSEVKQQRLHDFGKGKFRVLVTKAKIAQFGLNYQHCHNQVFAAFDFSFEGLYQAIRRSYRFGQKQAVNVHLITTDTMQNVVSSIYRKQKQFDSMMDGIVKQVNKQKHGLKMHYTHKTEQSRDWQIHLGDNTEIMTQLESNSMDFSVFSPPFSTLFTYSDNIRDMGNCQNDEEFFKQNQYMLKELYRLLKPGRLVAVHTKDLARYKNSSGYSGMYDFTGEYHRAMESVGFKYHSKITIWIDPVLEMQRTKTQRLLYKQVTSDSSYTGIGMPEYITIFRKWEGDESDWLPVTNKTKQNFPLETWQKWASPVWDDIQRTNVLNSYKDARDPKDEKHIAPLQLDVIERCIALWTNKGETVFTPFMGIGSEVYQAVKMGRKGVGVELKESYFETALRNIRAAEIEKNQGELFEL